MSVQHSDQNMEKKTVPGNDQIQCDHAAYAAPQKSEARPHTGALRRIVLAAVLLICLCLIVPALAIRVPSVYRLLYLVSPNVAQFFIPVQRSCTYDGVRMEVLSVNIHDSTVEICVTLQDLTGDRVDASIDLYDSYHIHIPFDTISTCNQVAYDPEEKLATFLIRIDTMDGSRIPSGKTTFSISCFLSGKQALLDTPISIDWSSVENDPETLLLNDPHGGDLLKNPMTGESETSPIYERVLKPKEPIAVLHDGFPLTGIGYIDGKLHIQLYTPGRIELDDHAFLELTDAQGTIVHAEMVYHDFVNKQTGSTVDYIDYVFDVPQTSLRDYTLRGSFYTAKSRTDGYWQVTFPLKTSGVQTQ